MVKRKKLTALYGVLKTDKPWPGIVKAREIASKKLGEEYVRKNKVR